MKANETNTWPKTSKKIFLDVFDTWPVVSDLNHIKEQSPITKMGQNEIADIEQLFYYPKNHITRSDPLQEELIWY